MTADDLIAALSLAPHPEGGWYRETWRTHHGGGARAEASGIYFLLRAGERSHWHRVDADELWLWHSGDPLDLSIAEGNLGPASTFRLGGAIDAGEEPQRLVPAGCWQAAAPAPGGSAGYSLVSCIVAPAFDFAGFQLAPPGWAPGGDGWEG